MFESCRTWQRRLTLYGEGSLPPSQKSQLLLHLSRCPQCQKAMEADEALRDFHETLQITSTSNGSEFEHRVLERLSAPLPLLERVLNRVRHGAQYMQQLLSGAIVAAALTGFCFFVTLHAPPQRTKTHLSETPLLPRSVQNEPPVPLSTLLQSPTPRAALLWTSPQAENTRRKREREQQHKNTKETPLHSGTNHNTKQHLLS